MKLLSLAQLLSFGATQRHRQRNLHKSASTLSAVGKGAFSPLNALLLLSLSSLTACGGGGGGSEVVPDTTAPVITLNGGSLVSHKAGEIYSDAGATATDNIDGSVSVVTTGSVDVNAVGRYTLTYTAKDSTGNQLSVQRIVDVDVDDHTSPVITFNGDSVITHNAGDIYTDAGATATDSLDGVVSVITTGSVNINAVNSYTITYTAIDAAGNQSSLFRTVNVVDVTPPVIKLEGESTINHNYGDVYTDLGAAATDNLDSSVTVTTSGGVNIDMLNSYIITYTATDVAGNTSSVMRTVNVADLAGPSITLNGAATVTLINSESYSEQGASAIDNVDGTVAVVISGEVETAPDTYTVTYTATDLAGHTTNITRSVVVQADILPNLFTFTEKNDAFLNTLVESASITVTGINSAVAVTVADGEYSIDGGAYSSAETTVVAGQTITVRATSADMLNQLTEVTLTVGSVDDTFAITTRTAEPSGIFEGTGSVNDGTNNLADVKGMIHNEHFMLFNEAENVLYEGNIQSYNGDSFSATVDIYKEGVNSQTVDAIGTIVNQTTVSLVLSGTGYGSGTIDLTYNALFERGATIARFVAESPYNTWIGSTNTVSSGQIFGLRADVDSDEFRGGPTGTYRCTYANGIKTIPDTESNFYLLDFDVEHPGWGDTCDHVGSDYRGFATVVDGGGRGTDGIMWFAASNGVNSSFSVFEYQ